MAQISCHVVQQRLHLLNFKTCERPVYFHHVVIHKTSKLKEGVLFFFTMTVRNKQKKPQDPELETARQGLKHRTSFSFSVT